MSSKSAKSKQHSGLPPTPPAVAAKAAPDYWRNHLFTRRYHFPGSGTAESDLAIRIDHEGAGCFFPLSTSDPAAAAALAVQIYQVVAEQGWANASRQFSRELVVSFEWSSNPVLWTYTTIHTLVAAGPTIQGSAPKARGKTQPVLILETDAGIRRALGWCLDQQAGFTAVACESLEAFTAARNLHPTCLVLLNRTLADRVGVKAPGSLAPLRPGVLALTYSVHGDGDQMFVSTPGGAAGYLVKRVKPDRLLEPMLNLLGQIELEPENQQPRLKAYFLELLQPPANPDSSTVAKLTPREREVLHLLSKGCVDKEIASALGISAWTVHEHIKSIFARLQVRTRTEAVVRYLEK